MANPAKLTVRTIVPNSGAAWPAVDVIDTTGMVPVVAADTGHAADRVALLVTARGAISARIAPGDLPPSVRQSLGDLTVPMASALAASVRINPAGANNDVLYTANVAGSPGNDLSVQYVDPGAASQALSVSVVDKAIVVRLATNAGSAITSTAAEVLAAVNAHWLAGHLVTAVVGDGAGAGVVTAMAHTHLAGGADMDATHAALSTNLAGDNNDVVWTAVVGGAAGNNTTIAYVDPAGNNQPLGVVVAGTAITVNLATDGAGAITSTADDIKDEVAATPAAAALVTGADKAANDGSGVVIAMAATALSGGANLTALYGPFEGARFTQSNGDLNINFEVINGEADVIAFLLPRT
jgi:hypothetical protein